MPRRALRFTLAVSAVAVAALAGCGGDDGTPVPAECNPLGSSGCALPWPSSIYQKADATSPTGVRLDVPLGALPGNVDGVEIDPAWINQRTGYSPMTQILLTFPGGVDDSNLVFYDDFPASLTDASPTVIVDMATNERVAHFAEVDVNEVDYPDRQVLYLRPAARLKGGAHYAVAIRKSLKTKGGGELRSRRRSSSCSRASRPGTRGSTPRRPATPRCSRRSRPPACRAPIWSWRSTS